jgi:hypothetical protein
MLWAAATLCFFGFLRSGEITIPNDGAFDESRHLSFGDISVDRFDNPSTLKARIKASKTDPFQGRGEHLCGAYRNQPLPSDSHARLTGGKGSGHWPSISISRRETTDKSEVRGGNTLHAVTGRGGQ